MNTTMKMLGFIAAFLMAASLSVAATLPEDASNIADIKVFRNISGSTQVHGTAYVLQDANTDSTITIGNAKGQESSLGMDVTTTTTADVGTFMGCQLDDSCINGGLCRVVVRGPAICKWAGLTDNTNTRMATVGTTTVAGQLGSGTLAGLTMSLSLHDGVALDFNGKADLERRWIWIAPDNN